MGSPGEYKKKAPTPTTVTQGYNFPRTQEMEAGAADYFSETGTRQPTTILPDLMPKPGKPPSSYLEKQMAQRGLDPDQIPQAMIGNPADWMKLAKPAGTLMNWLEVPATVNFWNILATTAALNPAPVMGETALLTDDRYNPELMDRIEERYIEKGHKGLNTPEGLKEYNAIAYAEAIKDIMGPDVPGWIEGIGKVGMDPLLGLPTKFHLPGKLTGLSSKIPKYIPNIMGGADWLAPFSSAGRTVSKVTADGVQYIDDLIRKAELIDQSAKNAGTELAGPGVRIVKTGKIPTPDKQSVHRLIQKIKEAKPLTAKQKQDIKLEKSERIARLDVELDQYIDDYLLETGDTEAATFKDLIRDKLGGEYKKVQFSPLLDEVGEGGSVFTQADYDDLARYVRHNTEGFNRVKTMQSLISMVEGGAVPPPSEIKRLEDLFGTEFADLIFDQGRTKFGKGFDIALDIAGIPRTMMASFDLSAPLRQGRVLGFQYPDEYADAWGAMHKAMASETGTIAIEQGIKNHPLYKYAEGADLFFAERGAGYGANATEEIFASRWASKMPGIRMSERAYTTFLNKFRHDVFFKTVGEWQAQGLVKSADDYKDLAQMVNWSTGRGPSPFKGVVGGRFEKLLNVAFFAPRFTSSGPAFVFGGAAKAMMGRNTEASKFWANSMVNFMQTSMMWLHQVQVAGGEVELDPRSSDFGKGKFGKERFDFFGGYLPMARYLAQFTTGQGKALGSGDIYEKSRDEVLLRWLQSKLSPTGGLGYDLYSGTDFLGQEFDWQQSGIEDWVQRLAPMIVGDIMDIMTLDDGSIGWNDPMELLHNPSALAGLGFSFYGGGYQAFEITKDLQNELSWKEYQKFYDDLTPDEVNNIDKHPAMREHFREQREARPKLSGKEQWPDDISDYHRSKEEILYGNPENDPEGVTGFVNIINNLPQGREQAQAIRDLKERLFFTWEDNISDDSEQWFESKKLLAGEEAMTELLRDKYWSIGAKPMVINGIPRTISNFDDRDRERQDLLEQAADRGYITRLDNGKINPDDPILKSIITEYPFASEFETDEEMIKFSGILEDYDKDTQFLADNYFGTKKDAIGRTPGVTWEQWMAYQLQPSNDVLAFLNPEWSALTKSLNISENLKRQIGWDERYPVIGEFPFTEDNKRLAYEITRIMVKWGRLDVTDPSIPLSLQAVLLPLFMERDKEINRPYIVR